MRGITNDESGPERQWLRRTSVGSDLRQTNPARQRWIVGSPIVPTESFSAGSIEMAQVPVAVAPSVNPANPTGASVYMAFMHGRKAPAPADWIAGSWDNGYRPVAPKGSDPETPRWQWPRLTRALRHGRIACI